MKIMVVQEPDMGSEKSAPESSFVERLSGKGHEVRVIDDWKTCIIIGTRPEIIKMSPVVRACERHGADWFVLHTGQHYSYGMDRVFFEQLGLSDAKYNLDVGSGRHGEQTGRMLSGIEKVKRTLDRKLQMKFEYEFENAHEWFAWNWGDDRSAEF